VFVKVQWRAGAITHRWLRRLQADLRVAFAQCYRQELQADPNAEGVVVVPLHLAGAKPRAASAPAIAGTLSQQLVDCTIAEVVRTPFETADSAAVDVDVHIRFVAPGRTP
jgi:hypothetical protein